MTPRPLLDSLDSLADFRRLPAARLPELAAEIRAELLEVVSRTGGHLASNLGVVELTLALLHTFDPDQDVIVWDTGHQGYVHKLLTGRRRLFQGLRQADGCCGFLHRHESPYDAFGAGHAGTAISAALGFAAARDRAGRPGRVIALVGDGALGCGVSLEGLNNIIETTRDFILVINDNKMAIAPNVGALARRLNRVIVDERYNRLKASLREALVRLPRVGRPLKNLIHRVEEAVKGMIVPGRIFEELGLRYMGPLNGHDLPGLLETFGAVRRLEQPLVLHVLTTKGYGDPRAEAAPEMFHGISGTPGNGCDAEPVPGPAAPTFSACLGEALCRRAAHDPGLVAITAGMCHGTGLRPLRERHPERLVDVGIAEEHAVVFAAGLAAAGFRPVVAIYATFMQRAVDYVFHDVCLQELPVVFCLDRAGIVEDGPTHHGIYDVAFWRAFPGLAVLQPADGLELEAMLEAAAAHSGPVVLRYPRGSARPLPVASPPLVWGRAAVVREGADLAIWAAGPETLVALEVAGRLAASGIEATVVNPRFLAPFDAELLRAHAARLPVVTLENHVLHGGLATIVDEQLAGRPCGGLLHLGWPATVLPWGPEAEIRRRHGLDPAGIAAAVRTFLAGRPAAGTPAP